MPRLAKILWWVGILSLGSVCFAAIALSVLSVVRQKSITFDDKILVLLERKGYPDVRDTVADVWMLTMPAYCGYDGMNPLTVYFVYKKDGLPWFVVLEARISPFSWFLCKQLTHRHSWSRYTTRSTNATRTSSK